MIVNYFSDLYDDLHKQKVPFFKYQRGGDVGLYLSFYRTKISINPGNILIYVILCNILASSDFAETADLFTRSELTKVHIQRVRCVSIALKIFPLFSQNFAFSFQSFSYNVRDLNILEYPSLLDE